MEQKAINEVKISFSKPKSIVQTVTEFLRESIISGNLKPKEKINPAEITKKLGVSNIPLREALRILENEGLILSLPGKGSWVASASRKDLEETFIIREMIETFAVDLISRMQKEGAYFKEKFQAIALAEQTQRKGPKFHDILIDMANNEKLFNIYDTLLSNIRRYQVLSLNILEKEKFDIQKHVKEHLLIVEELIKGDFEAAKHRIREHLDTLKKALLEHIEFWD